MADIETQKRTVILWPVENAEVTHQLAEGVTVGERLVFSIDDDRLAAFQNEVEALHDAAKA